MHTRNALLVALLAGVAVAAQAPLKTAVPLRPGLTIVTAVADERGDYESIKRITAVTDKGVSLSYTADAPADDDESPGPAKAREVRAKRTVLRADLQNAHEYIQEFGHSQPEVMAGATALGVSTAVLTELKTKGETKLTVMAEGIERAIGGLIGGLLGNKGQEDEMTKWSGTLRTVKTGPATLMVLVNGTPTPLPVVHAKGELGDTDCEFFFHDDPAHPITLKFSIGDTDLQVVRIEFPAEQPAATTTAGPAAGAGQSGGGSQAATSAAMMEQALQTAGRIDIYGIYFDFASDRIKPESEPVLREIAKVLSDNPTWSLGVDGHTDNIGGNAYNLDLSKRRAAAVKQALVTRYKVAPARLATSGYGASRPKAPNDTLAGRAQNRRVELVKQ